MRSTVVLCLAALIGLLLVVVHVAETMEYRGAQRALAAEGAFLITIVSSTDQPAAIERASCESLATQPDVERSGILLDSVSRTIGPTGTVSPIVQVSPGLLSGFVTSEVVIGTNIADRFDSGLLVVDGEVVRASAGADQPRGVPTDSALAVVAPNSVIEAPRCVVVFRPGADVQNGGPALIAQLNSQGPALLSVLALNQPVSQPQQFLDRPARFSGLAAGVMVGLALALLIGSRQSEMATYRIAGATRVEVIALNAVEGFVVGGFLAFFATLSTALVWPFLLAPLSVIAQSITGAAAATFIVVICATAISLRPVHGQLKTR